MTLDHMPIFEPINCYQGTGSHCKNLLVLSNHMNGGEAWKKGRAVPFKRGFWKNNQITGFILQSQKCIHVCQLMQPEKLTS